MVFTSGPELDDRDLLSAMQKDSMVTAMWSVSNRTGTSTSKSAVT
jgi:hypothetical protein